jgi:hypothetical protein
MLCNKKTLRAVAFFCCSDHLDPIARTAGEASKPCSVNTNSECLKAALFFDYNTSEKSACRPKLATYPLQTPRNNALAKTL